MRRAFLALILVLPLLSWCAAPARADETLPNVIDGSGLVDYTGRPTFKVGDWVKYHTQGSSLLGHKNDYVVTVIVAGEEVWWGEPCVWIETWFEQTATKRKGATASLVSYAAFGDTMADRHLVWFLRKTINGYDTDGKPDVSIYTRQASELATRRVNWEGDEDRVHVDSLGPDTVEVPIGRFDVLKVRRRQGGAQTSEKGDSTVYYERISSQTYYRTPQVPITHFARIDLDDTQKGKSWLAGQYDRGDPKILERAQGHSVAIASGHGGITPIMVPESSRRTIQDRSLVEHALSLPSEPPVKPLRRGGS